MTAADKNQSASEVNPNICVYCKQRKIIHGKGVYDSLTKSKKSSKSRYNSSYFLGTIVACVGTCDIVITLGCNGADGSSSPRPSLKLVAFLELLFMMYIFV